jgi:GNAT superfamily N-acetyltransferase
MIRIDALRPEDRPTWEELARGYKKFYATETSDEEYEATWQRLMAGTEVYGLGARTADGRLVGITHYLFHAQVWMADSCYLQDLFVAEDARGQGAARALIEAVAVRARERGAVRLYWTTQDHNTTARALYDKVAAYNGFIRYDYPLGAA